MSCSAPEPNNAKLDSLRTTPMTIASAVVATRPGLVSRANPSDEMATVTAKSGTGWPRPNLAIRYATEEASTNCMICHSESLTRERALEINPVTSYR